MVNVNVNVNVDEVYELNKKINELKKQLDEAKKALKANGVGDYAGDKYIACVKDRVKDTFNTDKCLEIIKKNKLNWLLKETVDEEKLENDIYNGTVDASLFQEAIETTHTFAVTFKKNKNKWGSCHEYQRSKSI